MSESRLPTRACSMPARERLLADVEEPLRLGRDLADRQRDGAVGDEPVERDAEVERDQVALPRAIVVRDPVHDHRVRRDAERGREALVALRGRVAALRRRCARRRCGRARASRRRARDARRRARASRRGARPRAPSPRSRPADLRMITPRAFPCRTLERVVDLVEDLVDGAVGVDADDVRLVRAVVLDERRGLPVVELEPPLDRLRRVVGAALLRRAAEQPLAAAPPGRRPGGRRRRRARGRARAGARRAPRPAASCAGSRRGRSRRACRRARAGRGSGGSSARPRRGRRGRRPPSAPGRGRSAAPSSRGSCRPSRCAESRTSP